MSLLVTKGLANDAVTGAKFKLDNDQALRARNNADSADVNLMKLDTSDVIQFLSHPEISTSASSANQVVTKKDLDASLEGLKPKEAARAASTANIDLATGTLLTIDGVALAADDRVLVKNQTVASQNGIYLAKTGAWVRTDDMNVSSEVSGAYVAVQEGTASSGIIYVQSGAFTTLDTDDMDFVFFNSSASISGGDGITFSANVISIDHDGEGLTFATSQLALELDGSTLSKSGTGLKVAAGGITETELASSVDAESFVLSAGYAAAAGTVTIGDTIEVAIEKLAGNQGAAATTAGREKFTLAAGDITNGYIDLAENASANSVDVSVAGLIPQLEGVDYTLSVPGAVTRITFAGDLASGGDAALVAGDVVHVRYMYA